MEIKSIAQSFFTSQLPDICSQSLDWNSLQIAESARRSPDKKTGYTDITYTCLLKEENIPIFLHCEQESKYGVTRMVERMFRYNAGLISQHRRQGYSKLPVIVNFVVWNHHPEAYSKSGPIQRWDYSEVPWLEKLLHGSYFYLLDLNQPDEKLASYGPCGGMHLLLKRARDRNFIKWLKEHASLLQGILVGEALELSTQYALAVTASDADEMLEAFSNLFPQYQQNIMKAARQLEVRGIQQGLQQGLQQGMQQGLQQGIQQGLQQGREQKAMEIVKNMLLNLHVDIDTVQKYTNLPKEEIQKLLQGKA